MRSTLAGLAGLALLLSTCGRSGGVQSKAAVEAAIERHLQTRPDVVLSSLTFDVQNVKFDGARAEADVKFFGKQAPTIAVDVHYVLRRVGDHWEVESTSATQGMGGNPHGGAVGPMASPAPATPTLQPSH